VLTSSRKHYQKILSLTMKHHSEGLIVSIHIVSFIVTAIIVTAIIAILATIIDIIDAVTAIIAEPLADAVTIRIDGNLIARIAPIILQPDIIVIVVVDIQQFVHRFLL